MVPSQVTSFFVAMGLVLSVLPGAGQAKDVLNKPLDEWARLLDDPNPKQRRDAAHALGRAGRAAQPFVPKLVQLLREDQIALVRDEAAYALGDIGVADEADAIAALESALAKDSEASVRRSAARSLGSAPTVAASVEAALRKALDDPEAPVRQNAAWALGKVGPGIRAESVAGLLKCMADADTMVRRDAAVALGEIGLPKAAGAPSTLLKLIDKEQDPTVRKAALAAVVATVTPGDRQSAAKLNSILQNRMKRGRSSMEIEECRAAALALAKIGGQEAKPALPILVEALRDEEYAQRQQAALALGFLGELASETVPAITKVLEDKDAKVRLAACLALKDIGVDSTPAIPKLIQLCGRQEPDDDVRRYAVEALVNMENNAAEKKKPSPRAVERAIPTLGPIIRDKTDNWRVRQRAVWALSTLPDLKKAGVVADLEATLDEKEEETKLVRYEAAVLLGVRLGSDVSDKVIDILLENLRDMIQLYNDSKGKIQAPDEARRDAGHIEYSSGDARWLPCVALTRIGKRANRPDIIEQLNNLIKPIKENKLDWKDPRAPSRDPKVRQHAKEALKAITGKEPSP